MFDTTRFSPLFCILLIRTQDAPKVKNKNTEIFKNLKIWLYEVVVLSALYGAETCKFKIQSY